MSILLFTWLPTTQILINHLKEHHRIPIESTNLEFVTFSEFLLWKEAEENRTNSLYVQTCAPQIRGENQHCYYYCNCSGIYQAKGQGKRQLKTQGSSKTGEQCTAHISSTKNARTGRVSVSIVLHIAAVAKRLCTTFVAPEGITPLLACHLIALDLSEFAKHQDRSSQRLSCLSLKVVFRRLPAQSNSAQVK